MLINKGKTEGLLTTEEISDALSKLALPKDQIENIFNIIDKLEIEIVSEEDEDRDLSKRKLDLTIKSPTNDPI